MKQCNEQREIKDLTQRRRDAEVQWLGGVRKIWEFRIYLRASVSLCENIGEEILRLSAAYKKWKKER
jgi:hypothetical protein